MRPYLPYLTTSVFPHRAYGCDHVARAEIPYQTPIPAGNITWLVFSSPQITTA